VSVSLTTAGGRPALEIADHKGECWRYLWEVTRGRHGFVVKLVCLDPKTGEPAVDRAGLVRTYAVTLGDGWASCHCPDSRFRARKLQRPCKHESAARELVELLRAMNHPAVAPVTKEIAS
jgi:hypothetical protein